MKLRIHQNSIRLRISRLEVEKLRDSDMLEHSLTVAPNQTLSYRLACVDSDQLTARFARGGLTVSVPRAAMRLWLESDQVAISEELALADGQRLAVLIEKDFACLVPRDGEDQSDLFPNPAKQ